MVEYVLGGSPTTKESPLALEPRMRGLKIDEKVNKIAVSSDNKQKLSLKFFFQITQFLLSTA
jgi:hypothetical protein